MAKEKYCTNCGTVAVPKKHTPGSILIEIVLWLCLFVPGIIYSIWRLTARKQVCPSCQAPNMVPLDSPRAKAAGIQSPT